MLFVLYSSESSCSFLNMYFFERFLDLSSIIIL
jgi:hypothetical protein